MKILFYVVASLLLIPAAHAKDFERFDGQIYNGQFYPMVDIIEWGEQDNELPHMEFHFHSKEKPMDIAVVPGEKGGRPVLWMMYDLRFRGGEKICRHVLAPSHFREGMKLYTYRDDSDPDYDNIYVYSAPLKVKGKKKPIPEYTMPAYERCMDENASNMPYPKGQEPSKVAEKASAATGRDPATTATAPVAPAAPVAPVGKPVPIDYDNAAVPFSF